MFNLLKVVDCFVPRNDGGRLMKIVDCFVPRNDD